MATVVLHIQGKVQGVGYRYFVQKKAITLKLTGWVKNETDGTVSCIATGSTEALEQFRKICFTGPPLSKVDEVKMQIVAEETFDGFVILPN